MRQERQETVLQEAAIEHNTSCRYFLVNTHALHNAASLRRHLPRSLFAPQSLYSDRKKRHQELAVQLRVTEANKRAATQKKRSETLQKKAQKRANAESSQHASGSGVETATRAVEARSTPDASVSATTDVRDAIPTGATSREEAIASGDGAVAGAAPELSTPVTSQPGGSGSGSGTALGRKVGTKRKRV